MCSLSDLRSTARVGFAADLSFCSSLVGSPRGEPTSDEHVKAACDVGQCGCATPLDQRFNPTAHAAPADPASAGVWPRSPPPPPDLSAGAAAPARPRHQGV